jgi:hypothetical protein
MSLKALSLEALSVSEKDTTPRGYFREDISQEDIIALNSAIGSSLKEISGNSWVLLLRICGMATSMTTVKLG